MEGKRNFIIKLLLISAGLTVVFLFVLPLVLFGILSIGNMLGIAAGLVLLLTGIFHSVIIDGIKTLFKKKCGRVFFIFLSAVCAAGFTVFIYATSLMISKISMKLQPADTVIVLGCQVIGNSPSIMLNERINACYEYLTVCPDSTVILSGGQGSDERISEAECMYRALTGKGIPGSRLIKEDKSTSTRENLLFSKKIIQEENLSDHILIITSGFHCYRATYFASKLGLKPDTYSAKTHWYLLPTFYMREICAIIAQCIFSK